MGVFGATAAAGKLLGLTVPQMLNAFGIAFSQAAGNRQCIVDGALTKRLQAGQAASSGVFAATLAREGFTGAHNIFLGRFGFFELYQPNGSDPRRLTAGLGTQFAGDQLSFKPYPCGRPQHAILDAAIAARNELGLTTAQDLAQIAGVTVSLDPATRADQFDAAAHKRRPTQIVEAQFALPFLIAAALVHGRLGIAEVANITDAAVLDLAARIEGQSAAPVAKPTVTVTLRDGRTAAIETRKPLGSPENQLSIAQLQTKFADCARNAVRPVPESAVEQAANVIPHLDDVENVSVLSTQFA
jgi:2-methylcitrate dehydratase PrpD